jgi:dTDP-4-amino-4,6-dideoxy-D-galactose acyltransferase
MIKQLEWDSGFFNLKVGQLIFDKTQPLSGVPDFDLIYVTSESDFDLEIEKFGNTFSEVKVKFAKEIKKSDFKSENIHSIDDIDIATQDLYQLAYESGKNSRFLLDKNFKAEDFKKLYRTWVDNSISKEIATDILVYADANEIRGFVTYKINDESASVGLIAVDGNHQEKGIGRQLLNHLESILFHENITKLTIPTQQENIQACNFYKKQGYLADELTYIKHYWKNDTI